MMYVNDNRPCDRPTCYGSQPLVDTVSWDQLKCLKCDHLESCYLTTRDRPIGTKHDTGKLRWSLLPLGTIAQVLKVLEFGATKYSPNNWMSIDNPQDRYYDAAMRHIEQWRSNEMNDNESGLHHLAHAICCLLFLTWFDGKKAE